jgi:hypothetical protein
MTQRTRSLISGRMLDGRLKLCFGRAHVPDAGYAVDLDDHGRLYRNGELQGYARAIQFDRNALGFWVEYEAFDDTPLGQPVGVPFVCAPDEHKWEFNTDPLGLRWYCPRCTTESMVKK